MGRLGALSPDVLIVGIGAAGASAAIAARDAGASVAVVEKTPSGGGNCVYSGGFLFEVDGPRAVDHLGALCFGKTEHGGGLTAAIVFARFPGAQAARALHPTTAGAARA
jgi:glycine/D-amino acid oxidase-like deaminating enzyme